MAWFSSSLPDLSQRLDDSPLGHATDWHDLTQRLRTLRHATHPARVLAELRDPRAARALLGELFDPPRFGTGLGRHTARLAQLADHLPPGPLRAWDVGTATGEGAWELAHTLGPRADVQGSTPCPISLAMAHDRCRPHDPLRTTALRAFIARHDLDAHPPRFVLGDLRRDGPTLPQHAITCHGVLGGMLDDPHDIRHALRTLDHHLAPRGLVSIADTFRDDLALRAAALLEASRLHVAPHWEPLAPGLYRAPSNTARERSHA